MMDQQDQGLFPYERMMRDATFECKVARGTDAKSLANTIVRCFDEGHRWVALSCIGADPVYTATKAITIINGELGKQGMVAISTSSFQVDVLPKDGGGQQEVTRIRILVSKVPVVLFG